MWGGGATVRHELGADVSTATYRTSPSDATTERASVPGPAPASIDGEVGRIAQPATLGVDPTGEHRAEQRPDLGRRDEVAAPPGHAAG